VTISSSLKTIEVEEWFDRLFSRPLGYVFALLARFFRLSPTQVSILSMISGIVSGYYFYFQSSTGMAAWGCIWITVAGLLDSADGQLARMTGTSSHLGMIIDGFVDNVVFVAVYVAGILYFFPIMGWWVVGIAVIAGFSHSVRSLVYDVYKNDCLYFDGDKQSYFREAVSEVKQAQSAESRMPGVFHWLFLDYVKKQWLFSTRSVQWYQQLVSCKESDSEHFKPLYKHYFVPILTAWALVGGTNVHRFLIMGFNLMGRFDLYLYSAIILNIPFLMAWLWQYRLDQQGMKAIKESC